MTDPRSPEELARMSPSAREQYLTRMATQDVSEVDGWLAPIIAPLQRAAAAAGAQDRALRLSSDAINSTRGVTYLSGATTSNAHYPGIEHKELKRYVDEENEPGRVGETSDKYFALSETLRTFGDRFSKAAADSQVRWEGEAGDAARDFFTKLGGWSESNADAAKVASETIYQQSDAASTAKNSMPEPIEFSWGSELSNIMSASNPVSFFSRIDDAFQKQEDSQNAHDEAARVMGTFDNSTYQAASKQPEFSEPPKFGNTGGGEPGKPPGGKVPGTGGSPNVGGTGGMGGGPGGGGYAGGSVGGYTPPGGGGGYTAPSSGGSGGLQPGQQVGVGSPGGFNPGGTNASNFDPSRYNPAASAGAGAGAAAAAAGLGAMPMGPMGPMGGAGGDATRSGGGMGRGGAFGPGGSGAGGPGTGGAAGGPGKLTGAAQPGGMGGATAAGAAKGGMGAGGRGGMGGMMGGGGGGKGQGGEDKEHQRKYVQDEEIDIGLHEEDEHGERMIDPETGLPVVPPVIGG